MRYLRFRYDAYKVLYKPIGKPTHKDQETVVLLDYEPLRRTYMALKTPEERKIFIEEVLRESLEDIVKKA